MDVSTIHKELNRGITRRFYLFTGDEWAVQQIYIEQIIACLKREFDSVQSKRVNSIADVIGKAGTKSFLKIHYVYIVRDDKQLMSEEKLQERLPKLLEDNTVILLLTNPDKRTKFYKKYQKDIAVFEPLKEHILKKYISQKISLNEKNIDRLIEVCESDYGRILLEIDKCFRYMSEAEEHGYDMDGDEAFCNLLEDGTIFIPPQDAVFDFVDAVLDCRPKYAFTLYKDCLGVGEATLVMISNLYTKAKQVLQVQSCESKDVAKTTGLTGWQIQNARPYCGVYSNSDLIYIMELCKIAEQGIKTGRLDEKYAMEYILVNCMF